MAEQTMVERVARALSAHVTVNALGGSVPTSHEEIGEWCGTLARAAIEAMREPTEEMKDAWATASLDGKFEEDTSRWDAGWTVMIDAALKPVPQGK